MSEYDNTNRGVLFKNSRKQTENHPDYTGSINIDGTEYWLSAWIKESRAGNKFLSLSIGDEKEPAREQASSPAPKQRPKRGDEFVDDDIPF